MSHRADSPTPEAVVDRHLEAYNAGDVDAFLDCFAADAVVAPLDRDAEPMASGHDAIRDQYEPLFEEHAPEAEILERVSFGPFVVDHERVRGVDGGPLEALAVYRVEDGAIASLWLGYRESEGDGTE